MAQSIEAKKIHFIPMVNETADTTVNWQQTCEIPVVYTELRIHNSIITYLRFVLIPEKPSGLDILAGGENLAIVSTRIRKQMMHRLEVACAALQEPDPPLNSELERQQLKEYFSPRDNNL